MVLKASGRASYLRTVDSRTEYVGTFIGAYDSGGSSPYEKPTVSPKGRSCDCAQCCLEVKDRRTRSLLQRSLHSARCP